jgi:hypothetical protein
VCARQNLQHYLHCSPSLDLVLDQSKISTLVITSRNQFSSNLNGEALLTQFSLDCINHKGL